jgi:hypothetical protein
MEEQVAALIAQNRMILEGIAALKSVVPRLESLESKVQQVFLGDPSKQSPSSASADTHVMVDSESASGGSASVHRPFPPNFLRGEHGDSPLMSRSLHQDSFGILRDPNIKMTPPQIDCKDQFKIKPKEFLDYFDNVEAFIDSWENQPGNKKKNLKFDDADRYALRNLKIPHQKQLSKLIKTIFDRSELMFVAPANLGSVIFWQSVTTAMAKAKLCAKLSTETSLQNCTRELSRIRFTSPFGLIDPDAFDDYIKKIQDCIAGHARMGYEVPESVVKDAIITALPDTVFQKDLFLLFGPAGTMYGHQSLEFLLSSIELRISTVMSQNLHAVVNRAVSDRDSKTSKFKSVHNFSVEENQEEEDPISELEVQESDEHPEDDQMQLMAFLAVANKEPCRRSGIGPDGKLKCKFLGGSKATCIFTHPESDLKLKGRGYTSSIPSLKAPGDTSA